MTEAGQLRVAVVVHRVPVQTPFLWYKFAEFLKRGWWMDMVSLDRAGQSASALLSIPPESRGHIHYSWPTDSKFGAALRLPLSLVDCFARNPAGTWRYLRGAFRQFGGRAFRYFYLDAALIAVRPDIVHFEFGPMAIGRMHLRELLGCAVSVSFRGYDLNFAGLGHDGYYDDVWREADGLHFLGEDLWNRAQARGCPSGKNHVLIPPAVDTNSFAPRAERRDGPVGSRERPLRLVSVGRLIWKKGYDFALQAVRLLEDRGIACDYRIVGDGDYMDAIAFARHQSGLGDVVTFVGSCPAAEIRKHLEWADVFVHPAVSEGFCNAVVEAQANALPAVTSDAGGLRENVVDGETGFVVARRRPVLLADRLEQLARDGDLRRRMGAAGQIRAVRQFSLASQIDAFERFYRDVAVRRQAHAS